MPHEQKKSRPTPDQLASLQERLSTKDGVGAILRAGRFIYVSLPQEGSHNTIWISPEGFRNQNPTEATFYEVLPDESVGSKLYHHTPIMSEETFALVSADDPNDLEYYIQIDGLAQETADNIVLWRTEIRDQMVQKISGTDSNEG